MKLKATIAFGEGYYSDIGNCARCGEVHNGMAFVEFKGSPVEDSGGTLWTHWGICSTMNEPVFARTKEKKNESEKC